MAKIVGFGKIEDILNAFLAPFGATAELGTEWAYYPELKVIDFPVVESINSHNEFMATVERFDPDVEMDGFLWSLLHELGHHITIPQMPLFQYNICHYAKVLCGKGLLPRLWYYEATDERKATKWAVKYANSHLDELRELWLKLQPALMEFYALNNVETDDE